MLAYHAQTNIFDLDVAACAYGIIQMPKSFQPSEEYLALAKLVHEHLAAIRKGERPGKDLVFVGLATSSCCDADLQIKI